MDRKNAVIAALTILLIFSTLTSFLVYQQQRHMIESQEDVIEQLISTRNAESVDRSELPAFITDSQSTSSSSAHIVAVRSDTSEGVIGTVHVTINDGTGNVLVNTNPFVEPDT